MLPVPPGILRKCNSDHVIPQLKLASLPGSERSLWRPTRPCSSRTSQVSSHPLDSPSCTFALFLLQAHLPPGRVVHSLRDVPFPKGTKTVSWGQKISYYFYLENTQIHTRHIQIYNRTHMYTQDINRYTVKFHWGTIRKKIPKKPL